jgi:hypothetical protein
MRWSYWLLGIAGVLQYAIMVAMKSSNYVSLDTSYLVMWLAIIGAAVGCWMSCGSCYGGGGGCGCCGDDCSCGDCDSCKPGMGHEHGHEGHEGHDHGPGEHH